MAKPKVYTNLKSQLQLMLIMEILHFLALLHFKLSLRLNKEVLKYQRHDTFMLFMA